MKNLKQTEVLVVGAGPVGMFTALLLAKNGVDVSLIDKESKTVSRSYGCALHPDTLELIARFEPIDELLARGRRIQSISFYDGHDRRAQIDLSQSESKYPFALILPQSSFESWLEHRLIAGGRVDMFWNHRLASLDVRENGVIADVEKLIESGKGYAVPRWDWEVGKVLQFEAGYVVGADGHHSHVRDCLGVEYRQYSEPQRFAIFEFQSSTPEIDDVRVVFHHGTTNVLWPLPDGRYRWSFELLADFHEEFPTKERGPIVISDPTADAEIRRMLDDLLTERAPWFGGDIGEIEWCTEVQFQTAVVSSFGHGRCWLVGDAAHQIGPIAVQSMNTGFHEAFELSTKLEKVVVENGPEALLGEYAHDRERDWNVRIHLGAQPLQDAVPDDWIRNHAQPIASSVPVSSQHLGRLLHQLKLEPTIEHAVV